MQVCVPQKTKKTTLLGSNVKRKKFSNVFYGSMYLFGAHVRARWTVCVCVCAC